MLAKVVLTPYFCVEMWTLFSAASSIPQLRTLLEVQSAAFDHHNGQKENEEKAPLTSPYWLSIRMRRSVRLKMSRQSKSGVSGRRSSGGPLCRKLRMCLEEKGASSSVLSMKSITDGLRMVSYEEESDFFNLVFFFILINSIFELNGKEYNTLSHKNYWHTLKKKIMMLECFMGKVNR